MSGAPTDDDLDVKALAVLRALSGPDAPGFAAGVLRKYLARGEAYLEEMRRAAAAGDAKAVALSGHAWKGASAQVGARAVAAACAEAERAANAGDLAAAIRAVEAAARAFSRTRPLLEREAGAPP